MFHLVPTSCSSPSLKWRHDDGNWVSYDAIHIPTLEKTYRQFVCKADKPSRAFIELSIGHGSFRYQFDFREQSECAAAAAAADAPHDTPLCAIVGTQTNLKSMRAREIRRCTSASPAAPAPAGHSEPQAVDEAHRAELLLEAMQTLSKEFEMCITSFPSPGSGVVHDCSIDGLSELQSTLMSATFNASRSTERHQWTQLASELPLVLSMKTRSVLFRKVTGTTAEDFQNTKKDRINGVDRSRILEWAAAIAAASRGRRNPLAIQVIPSAFTLRFCALDLSHCARLRSILPVVLQLNQYVPQFSQDGVPEPGFGEAVTTSFFCDVADAFGLGDSCFHQHIHASLSLFCRVTSSPADSGMWTISSSDIDAFQISSDGRLGDQQHLAPSNGLYPQPYCASLPMPPAILGRCVSDVFYSSPLTCVQCSFKLLGTMMAKALHDGRVFPLPISYALARCICGQALEFDDLSGIVNFFTFDVRRRVYARAQHCALRFCLLNRLLAGPKADQVRCIRRGTHQRGKVRF